MRRGTEILIGVSPKTLLLGTEWEGLPILLKTNALEDRINNYLINE